ncbi:hypothetical protein NDU88_003151 [Pleurodeles waltl]|uniref:Uncharacterized protein n=1 Tax=Pleurodeles waltl TaxID=8319 RepID=A0AAV7VH43_PLEWA|nr:hypothetical protein NDU88_003151 [Pleurodeles waltl]
MPSDKSNSKPPGKLAQELLFTEALLQTHHRATAKGLSTSSWADDPAGSALDTTTDCILQEITVVWRKLEGMDSNISPLTAENKSIRMDVVGFQNHVTDLEHRIWVVDGHLNTLRERDQELLFL